MNDEMSRSPQEMPQADSSCLGHFHVIWCPCSGFRPLHGIKSRPQPMSDGPWSRPQRYDVRSGVEQQTEIVSRCPWTRPGALCYLRQCGLPGLPRPSKNCETRRPLDGGGLPASAVCQHQDDVKKKAPAQSPAPTGCAGAFSVYERSFPSNPIFWRDSPGLVLPLL